MPSMKASKPGKVSQQKHGLAPEILSHPVDETADPTLRLLVQGYVRLCVGPLDPSKVRKDFQRLLKRAEILRRRVYDSQHTFGSLRLAEGTPLTLREPPDGPQLTGDDTPLLRSVDT